MRKRLKKIWQKFLVVSFVLAIIGTIFWACCLDTDSWIPTVMLGINLGWVLLITISNDPERIEESKRREKTNGIKSEKDNNGRIQRRSA